MQIVPYVSSIHITVVKRIGLFDTSLVKHLSLFATLHCTEKITYETNEESAKKDFRNKLAENQRRKGFIRPK